LFGKKSATFEVEIDRWSAEDEEEEEPQIKRKKAANCGRLVNGEAGQRAARKASR
jgi:hypothetical protein